MESRGIKIRNVGKWGGGSEKRGRKVWRGVGGREGGRAKEGRSKGEWRDGVTGNSYMPTCCMKSFQKWVPTFGIAHMRSC